MPWNQATLRPQVPIMQSILILILASISTSTSSVNNQQYISSSSIKKYLQELKAQKNQAQALTGCLELALALTDDVGSKNTKTALLAALSINVTKTGANFFTSWGFLKVDTTTNVGRHTKISVNFGIGKSKQKHVKTLLSKHVFVRTAPNLKFEQVVFLMSQTLKNRAGTAWAQLWAHSHKD